VRRKLVRHRKSLEPCGPAFKRALQSLKIKETQKKAIFHDFAQSRALKSCLSFYQSI
jgi:hypothetical protein